MQELLASTKGQAEYRHTNGEISKVRIEPVVLGMRKIRIACLPPEVHETTLRIVLGKSGEIRDIQGETWSNAYRYPVANGIRIAMLNLAQHIPSSINVAGFRALISYEGQPTTCYGCNEIGHLYIVCPHRKRARAADMRDTRTSWADVAAKGTVQPQSKPEVIGVGKDVEETVNMEPRSTEEPNTEPQRWEKPPPREETDLIFEPMQVTEPDVDGQDKLDNRVDSREKAVDDVTDIEGEEVEVREEVAEGQTTTSQQTHGNIQRLSKQREMRKCGGTLRTGGEWAESEHTATEDEMDKTATPSSPKKTKKLKVEKRGEPPPAGRRSRTRNTIPSSL
jgi:hypothetical protein